MKGHFKFSVQHYKIYFPSDQYLTLLKLIYIEPFWANAIMDDF